MQTVVLWLWYIQVLAPLHTSEIGKPFTVLKKGIIVGLRNNKQDAIVNTSASSQLRNQTVGLALEADARWPECYEDAHSLQRNYTADLHLE